jgi:hypothetical protein
MRPFDQMRHAGKLRGLLGLLAGRWVHTLFSFFLDCSVISVYTMLQKERNWRENSGFLKARSVIGAMYVSTLENKIR